MLKFDSAKWSRKIKFWTFVFRIWRVFFNYESYKGLVVK